MRGRLSFIATCLLLCGCHHKTDEPVEPSHTAAQTQASAAAPAQTSADSEDEDIEGQMQELMGGLLGMDNPLPDPPPEVGVDRECPPAPADAAAQVAAQAKALVPLKSGLTLVGLWGAEDLKGAAGQGHEYELLEQLGQIEDAAIVVSGGAKKGGEATNNDERAGARRICRSDLNSAYIYDTARGSQVAKTLVGTTAITLSTASFAELKSKGTTRHRYMEIANDKLQCDLDGKLEKQSTGTINIIVNSKPVDLPVIRAGGTLRGSCYGKPSEKSMQAAILDDANFPLVLDYGDGGQFRINYVKITYPTEGALELQLREQKKVDIYGIYFDFASDRIRKESEPVLKEIVQIMEGNPDWKLNIFGHTDNIGGPQSNLELSKRRSESVRRALIERGIAAERLAGDGYGEGAPVATNDTPEGRARNRRVELMRSN